MVRRGAIPTLAKYLTNEIAEVRLHAAEALRFLSDHPETPEPMSEEKGLLEALVAASHNAEENDPTMFAVVSDVIRNLDTALDRIMLSSAKTHKQRGNDALRCRGARRGPE